jgi:hypothetical protein
MPGLIRKEGQYFEGVAVFAEISGRQGDKIVFPNGIKSCGRGMNPLKRDFRNIPLVNSFIRGKRIRKKFPPRTSKRYSQES